MNDQTQKSAPGLTDVQTLRKRAREHVESGAVTSDYAADREVVLRLLNEALATELVCVLRYRRHYYMADGINAESVKQEFLEHADEEQMHANQLAQRIVQLDGEPDFDPRGLAERSHAEYVECNSLEEMIRENLVAERVAIESYREMVTYIGHDDSTTRRLLESILAKEEEHAEDLMSIMRKNASRPATAPAASRSAGASSAQGARDSGSAGSSSQDRRDNRSSGLSSSSGTADTNHGEGDPESAARFNAAETGFVESPRGKQRIREGVHVSSKEEAELKEAERLAAARAKGTDAPPAPLNQ